MSEISYLIDSHQHFWKYDAVKYSWIGDEMANIQRDFLPSDLQPHLRKLGIDGTILVQAEQSEEETEFLLKLAQENPFIKGVVGWVDLSAKNVKQRLHRFAGETKFKGVRHTVYDKEGEFMKDPDFQKGISCLREFDLSYDILVFDYQLPGAIALARNFPNQRFVLDHMAKPGISPKGPSEFWEEHIKKLASSSNVHCKISGLFTETPGFQWEPSYFDPFLQVVTDAFGSERLMFGSDWPVSYSAASYRETLEIPVQFFQSGNVDYQDIFGRNAARFYRVQTG